MPDGLLRDVLGHEVPHLAGARAADAQALAPARVVVVVRLRVDRVERVVAIDVEAADAAELIPGVEVLAVLVEDLDAAVAAIGDEQPAASSPSPASAGRGTGSGRSRTIRSS